MTALQLQVLSPSPWPEYELLDTGDEKKLERFGAYRLVRPEPQAIWTPTLAEREWARADAIFQRMTSDEGPGQWMQPRPLPETWSLHYDNLTFLARLTPFRHTGIFPEHCAHWGWIEHLLATAVTQPNVLVLFGYTGLTSLFAIRCGARVCHVDASQPAVRWAKENLAASHLADRTVRWIVDDVSKFVAREVRRGVRYDLIIMDPPVFGRGPKGEIWRLGAALPNLIDQSLQLLSDRPLGLVINAYATTFSSLSLANLLDNALQGRGGSVEAGELALLDTIQRPLSTALYARWTA